MARAAIAAMREPTQKMIFRATLTNSVGDQGEPVLAEPGIVFRAMIDAALAEKSDE